MKEHDKQEIERLDGIIKGWEQIHLKSTPLAEYLYKAGVRLPEPVASGEKVFIKPPDCVCCWRMGMCIDKTIPYSDCPDKRNIPATPQPVETTALRATRCEKCNQVYGESDWNSTHHLCWTCKDPQPVEPELRENEDDFTHYFNATIRLTKELARLRCIIKSINQSHEEWAKANGWKSPEEVDTIIELHRKDQAIQTRVDMKAGGWVKLAKEQNYPDNYNDKDFSSLKEKAAGLIGYGQGQESLWEACWRKVELREEV